jgi:hypothetical protein
MLRKAVQGRSTMNLYAAIDVVRFPECINPRDRTYDVLSLIDWSDLPGIFPDYGIAKFELALKVLEVQAIIDGARDCDSSYYPKNVELAAMLVEELDLNTSDDFV